MIKRLIKIIIFLIPIYFSSFNKTTFFIIQDRTNIIVHLKDRNEYLELNDYITGVVASEMPASFNKEALKAQAVAARSFATSQMNNNIIEITSTINDQVYSPNYKLSEKWKENYKEYYEKINKSVQETTTEVIKRDNKILKTYYFSMSNGYTENSYTVFKETTFTSVESNEDETNQNYISTKIFTTEELQEKLKLSKIEIGKITRNETNHVDQIIISGQTFTGIELRNLLKLRSTDFQITQKENNYEIMTKGYGHGVGMSQYGANYMAKEGKNYQEILNHYYQNTEIEKI